MMLRALLSRIIQRMGLHDMRAASEAALVAVLSQDVQQALGQRHRKVSPPSGASFAEWQIRHQ
jgi:hypothetical protein